MTSHRHAPVVLLAIAGAFAAGMLVPRVPAEEIRVGWREAVRAIAGPGDTVIALPPVILVRDSVSVLADSLLLIPGYDYRVDYPARTVRLTHSWPSGTRVRVRYRALPGNWTARREWMRPVPLPPDTGGAPEIAGLPGGAASRRAPEPSGDLRIGGTKTFAVQVGSNRDLALEQSLRVSVSGTVAENVRVTAELSDQNLPIQPEGTTEDIREIDKVLVEIESPHHRALLGSYDVAWNRGEFGRYARRLDGAQVESRYDRWSLTGGVASARGRFRSYRLPLIDGIQGPYRLTDESGNPNVLVVAGTERVWLDGVPLRRGMDNDYTIDYSAGEIAFTKRRIVTNDMRVVVDYEYASEDYGRTSALSGGTFDLGDGRLAASAFFAQEGDNPDDPLAFALDENTRALIAAAGDDPLGARRPGWTAVAGGAYVAESLDSARFRYVGTGGDYDVAFTRVGPGRGTYTRSAGLFAPVYTFRGPGLGDWVPFVLYPLPRRHRVGSFITTAHPARGLGVEGEIAASEVDANVLSPTGDRDNTSYAGRLSIALDDTPLRPAGRDLGAASFSLVGRAVQTGFLPLVRTTPPEDNRRWGLPVGAERGQERTLAATLGWAPRDGHRLALDAGWFDRDTVAGGPARRATRAGARWTTTSVRVPRLDLFAEHIRSEATDTSSVSSVDGRITRANGEIEAAIWRLAPAVRAEGEVDESRRSGALIGGTRYGEGEVRLATRGSSPFAISASVTRRIEQARDTALVAWVDRERSITQVWRTAVRGWRGLTARGEYSWRRREGPAVGPASVSDVADVDVSYDPWEGLARNSVRYRVAATRTSRREPIYIRVPDGRGEYAPVIPDDDRAFLGESEVMEVPPGDPRASYVLRYRDTGDFRPTVSLDAAYTLAVDLGRAWRGAADPRSNRERPLWQRALRAASTETRFQVTEVETLRAVDLYLMKFWTFRDPGSSPTVRGSLDLIQDLNLRTGARGDLRFRARAAEDYDASLLGASGATPAITRTREYSTRGRVRFPDRQVDWVSELAWEREDRAGSRFDYRARRFLTRQAVAWHPTLQVEYALTGSGGVGWDPSPDAALVETTGEPLRAHLVGLEPAWRRAWGNRGLVRLTAEWTGVLAPNLAAGQTLPLRLLEGRNAGQNFRWTAIATYRLSELVTAALTYDGRRNPGRAVVHTGRMELRAVF